jgi:hypothetical protein
VVRSVLPLDESHDTYLTITFIIFIILLLLLIQRFLIRLPHDHPAQDKGILKIKGYLRVFLCG